MKGIFVTEQLRRGATGVMGDFEKAESMIATHRNFSGITWVLALYLVVSSVLAADPEIRHFHSPVAAVDGLLEALRSNDAQALSSIFGPASDKLLSSGDEVADQEGRKHFLSAADQHSCIERETDDRVILSVGEDRWPFPIPLLRAEAGWYFDTEAGAEEIINRRIGKNELHAIATALAYVDSQFEYYAQAPMGDAVKQYAQHMRSSEGKRDGLYWPAAEGEAESPLGPLIASAVEEGYGSGESSTEGEPGAYHGYRFRILTAQGMNAPGGAKNYITDAGMTGGFALVAYPAEYDNSGIMSFIVNQRGILYQKDLGPDTAKVAAEMAAFDPDSSWEPVPRLEN